VVKPEASSPNSPRWQRRPDTRPEELICAARDTFGELGFAQARLEDVARRAGVSKGTVYLYFDSKETLFREMVKACVVSTFAEGEECLRHHQGTAKEALEIFVRRLWQVVRRPEMTGIARLVQSELHQFPELARFYVDTVIHGARQLVGRILEDGIRRGEFRPVQHDFAVRAIPSLLVNSAMFQQFFGPYDTKALTDDQVVEGILDLVYHGVLAQPEPSRQGARS